MSKLISVNDLSFKDEVEDASLPVLVEFGAAWCGPCTRQLPILESLSEEYADKLKVVKVDIDDSPDISAKFHIRSVPTLMIFSGGDMLHSQPGLASPDAIKKTFLSKVGI